MSADVARAGVDACWRAEALAREGAPTWHARPDLAVPIWRGLVGGEWSIVDQFDRDGKRHFLVRRNAAPAPAAPAPPARLSPRERRAMTLASQGHANKAIAFELGVAPSTVSGLLSRAATKLGAPSRAAALRAFAAASRPPLADAPSAR